MSDYKFFEKPLNIILHETAIENKDKIAIVDGKRKIKYSEVEDFSNAVCDILQKKNILNDSKNIVLLFDNNAEKIFATVGVLKAGMTYVPLDTHANDSRNIQITKNVNSKIILTDEGNKNKALIIARECSISADSVIAIKSDDLHLCNTNFVCFNRCEESNAYIIHTSGSTGTPKGVVIPDKSLKNFCLGIIEPGYIVKEDNISVLNNFAFDFSVFDMFPGLCCGATLVIIPENVRRDVDELNEFFNKNNVTISGMTTVLYNLFLECENNSLRSLFTGGEKMTKFKNKPYEIYNAYGPTESTVFTTIVKIDKNIENFPIGKPLLNIKLLVVDDNDNIVDVDCEGELCISGKSLASGYINNDDETKKRFVPCLDNKSEIMYRSGDIVVKKADGNYYWIGRKDFQVKINGFRIEPEEINHKIVNMKAISESTVIVTDSNINKVIVCFYNTYDKNEISTEKFRECLKEYLPSYMIPTRFIYIDSIPVNNNGKTDILQLKALLNQIQQDESSIESDLEGYIREIWCELTGAEKNFNENLTFNEIGGNSILGMIMVGKVKEKLGIDISLAEMFEFNTLRGFLDLLNSKNSKNNILEDKIREIWCELTGAEKKFNEDLTFNEIGGNSILGMIMVGKVKEKLGIDISLAEMFEYNTLRKFINLVDSKNKNIESFDCTQKNDENRYNEFEMNQIQEAYFVGRDESVGLGNIPTHIYFELECDNFDFDKFKNAVEKTVELHDALRMKVNEKDMIYASKYEYGQINISHKKIDDISVESSIKIIEEERVKIISYKTDLKNEFPFRICAFSDKNNRGVILIYIDGLFADGWSQQIIIENISSFYSGKVENVKSPQHMFRDYNLYIQDLKNKDEYKKAEEFWNNEMNNMSDIPMLPLKCSADSIDDVHISTLHYDIGNDIWNKFIYNCEKNNSSVYSTLITIFGSVISQKTKNRRFLVNIPILRRFFKEVNFDDIVGTCSSFALADIGAFKEESFEDECKHNDKRIHNIVSNSIFSGIDIIHMLENKKNIKGFSVPVVFTSNIDAPNNSMDDFKLKYVETRTSQMWLDVFLTRSQNGINIMWNYISELFESNIILSIADDFIFRIKSFAETGRYDVLDDDSMSYVNSTSAIIKNLIDDIDDCYLKEENANGKFILYYSTDSYIDSDDIDEILREKLPSYMIPDSYFEVLSIERDSKEMVIEDI